MASYKELQQQIVELQQLADQARRTEVSAVIADIKAKMAEYAITAADLGGRGARADVGRTVPAKYRNAATGETWSGRGKRPRWLVAEIAGGRQLEDFVIA